MLVLFVFALCFVVFDVISDRTGPDGGQGHFRYLWLRNYHSEPLNMSTSGNTSANNQRERDGSDDTKHRRANRSTKVSGKLKVLPEQPEPGPVPTKRALLAPAQGGEGSGATGDSDDDDGDGGPDEDETEDLDVRSFSLLARHLIIGVQNVLTPPNPQPFRHIIRSRACPRAPRVETRYGLRRRRPGHFLA